MKSQHESLATKVGACLREKLLHDNCQNIVMRVEMGMCNCLRNNAIYYHGLSARYDKLDNDLCLHATPALYYW